MACPMFIHGHVAVPDRSWFRKALTGHGGHQQQRECAGFNAQHALGERQRRGVTERREAMPENRPSGRNCLPGQYQSEPGFGATKPSVRMARIPAHCADLCRRSAPQFRDQV